MYIFRSKIPIGFCCLIIAWIAAAQAQEANQSDVFIMLKPLVGHSFIGTFPDGKTTDVQHYEWVYAANFIRNRHEVRNPEGKAVYAGESIYALDTKSNQVVFWYWNSTGGYVDGTIEKVGHRLVINGENHGPNGQVAKVRSSMWDIDQTGYKTTAYFWKNGAWEEQWTIAFKSKEDSEK